MVIRDIFDHTLKVIARNYADVLLQLAFPKLPMRLIGTLENVELALPIRPVDFVHRVIYQEQEYLLHIEFQWQHESDFPQRIASYHNIMTEQFKRPVLSLAIYLRPRVAPLPDAYEVSLGDQVINRFSYPVLRLWDHVADIRNGTYYVLAPLLLELAPEQPKAQMLQEERALIMKEPDAQKRADLLALAVAVATRHFDRRYLWQFFSEAEVIEMQNSAFFDDLFSDRVEQVKVQFFQQGHQEGLQEGELKGARQASRERILDVLIARFDLSAAQYRHIEKRLMKVSDVDILRDLLLSLVKADDVAAFEHMLQATLDESEPQKSM